MSLMEIDGIKRRFNRRNLMAGIMSEGVDSVKKSIKYSQVPREKRVTVGNILSLTERETFGGYACGRGIRIVSLFYQ